MAVEALTARPSASAAPGAPGSEKRWRANALLVIACNLLFVSLIVIALGWVEAAFRVQKGASEAEAVTWAVVQPRFRRRKLGQ